MNDTAQESPTRQLFYIPIIHTQADLGSLFSSVDQDKQAVFDQFWTAIESGFEMLDLGDVPLRVFQDGLPICDHVDVIMDDMAKAGSRNYQLLLKLAQQGAVIMGTEPPDLLVEEYQFQQQIAVGEHKCTEEIEKIAQSLLDRRDEAIAERISTTLLPGELGLLFVGGLHKPERFLPPWISVSYPFGRR